tara:strand:- start:369 stop:572 length:204 start_codon:yes stop_codon:yes gene_type:complete
MKSNLFKDMTQDQLLNSLEENKESLENLKFQQSLQQLENTSQIKKVKKNIARLKTVMVKKKSINIAK